MTTIAGYTDGKRVTLAADSRLSAESRRKASIKKIFRIRNMIIGGAGDTMDMQVLDAFLNPRKMEDGEDAYHYIVKEVAPSIRDILNTHGRQAKASAGELYMQSHLLIGMGSRLFNMGFYFSVQECHRGYDAIGSGGDYAVGALYHQLKQDKPSGKKTIKTMLRHALDAACEWDLYSGGDYQFETT